MHIPNSESNITKRVDELPRMYAEKTQVDGDRDLLVWFAGAALVLLAAEWLLHAKENSV